MPGLKNAEKDGAVGFVLNGRRLEAAFQVTAVHKQARICVEVKGERLLEECLFLEPGQPCLRSLETAEGTQERIYRCFFLMNRGKPWFPIPSGRPFSRAGKTGTSQAGKEAGGDTHAGGAVSGGASFGAVPACNASGRRLLPGSAATGQRRYSLQ